MYKSLLFRFLQLEILLLFFLNTCTSSVLHGKRFPWHKRKILSFYALLELPEDDFVKLISRITRTSTI